MFRMGKDEALAIAVDTFMERVPDGDTWKMQGPTEVGRGDQLRLVFDFWPPRGSAEDPATVVRVAVHPDTRHAEVLR